MKKFLPLVLAILLMLAILILPAYWLIQHPEMLVVPSIPSAGGIVEGSFDLAPAPDAGTFPAPMLALSPTADAGTWIFVTAESVNLRDDAGNASGLYLHDGDRVSVIWQGNWGLIVKPEGLSGLEVWRGCTSDAGNLGCEAK